MPKPFFAMLYTQRGDHLVPLCNDKGHLLMFETLLGAQHAARQTFLGEHFGFEVFEAGSGLN